MIADHAKSRQQLCQGIFNRGINELKPGLPGFFGADSGALQYLDAHFSQDQPEQKRGDIHRNEIAAFESPGQFEGKDTVGDRPWSYAVEDAGPFVVIDGLHVQAAEVFDMDPADHLAATAEDSGDTELYRLLKFGQGAPLFTEHDAGTDDDQPLAELGDGGNGGLPEPAGFAEKIIVGWISLFERPWIRDLRIGAIPADGGRTNHGLHFIGDVAE